MNTSIKLFLIASLFGFMAVPGIRASEFDKKTFVTFHQEMEIPGMVLPAGDYVMKRADRSLPDVVQFASSNENHVFATVFAFPTYRPEPTDKVVIITEERPANAPEAIKKWFYPGDTIGAEFVYPKSSERLMAMATTPTAFAPPANESAEPAAQTPAPEPSPSEQPAETVNESPQPLEVAQSNNPQAPAQSNTSSGSQTAQTSPAQSAEPSSQEELPKTASNLPLVGLFGLFSIFGGWAVRKLSRHLS